MPYDQVLQLLSNASNYCVAESMRLPASDPQALALIDAALILTAQYCDIVLEQGELMAG